MALGVAVGVGVGEAAGQAAPTTVAVGVGVGEPGLPLGVGLVAGQICTVRGAAPEVGMDEVGVMATAAPSTGAESNTTAPNQASPPQRSRPETCLGGLPALSKTSPPDRAQGRRSLTALSSLRTKPPTDLRPTCSTPGSRPMLAEVPHRGLRFQVRVLPFPRQLWTQFIVASSRLTVLLPALSRPSPT